MSAGHVTPRCEDDSPKDYWRTYCVEMDSDCRSRQLEYQASRYPECRSSCTADMTDEELLATANPDGGHCLLCPALPVDEESRYSPDFSRGCQCVPTEEDLAMERCDVQVQGKDIEGSQCLCPSAVRSGAARAAPTFHLPSLVRASDFVVPAPSLTCARGFCLSRACS